MTIDSNSNKKTNMGFTDQSRIIGKILPFAISTVYKSGPIVLILLAIVTVLTGLMPTVLVYVAKLVLNAIIAAVQEGNNSENYSYLIQVLILQLIVFIINAILHQINTYLNFLLGRRLSLNMNSDIIKKVSSLDYVFFDTPASYDMMTRAKREAEGKPLLLVLKVSFIVRGIITLISMGGLVASFSPSLLLGMLIVCLPLFLIKLKYGKKGYKLEFRRTEDQRIAGYTSGIMMNRANIPEILSFGLWEYLFRKWYTASKYFFRQDMQLNNRRTMAETLAFILTSCSEVVATGYIVYISIINGATISVGDIMMYSAAFAGGLAGLRTTLEGVSGIYENALFLNDLADFYKVNSRIEIKGQGKPVPNLIESIEFLNVSFKYPSSQKYVLKNVNLVFKHSENTLIIGKNGAGKTTLIKLLTRLYDATEGQILINGIDIKEYEIESLRKNIGIIFQEFIRYAFTVKENIGCGDIGNLENSEKYVEAAERSNADSFIKQLPYQYDTILTRLFKDGQELSLGQWQRICLARLFMKDAPVFIFDEPTANLDIETEAHLLKEISQLSRDKICILVSHRMFRQGISDRIVVLGNGEVLETGTYNELVAKDGEFMRLCKLFKNIEITK